jgi:hypothetical protein
VPKLLSVLSTSFEDELQWFQYFWLSCSGAWLTRHLEISAVENVNQFSSFFLLLHSQLYHIKINFFHLNNWQSISGRCYQPIIFFEFLGSLKTKGVNWHLLIITQFCQFLNRAASLALSAIGFNCQHAHGGASSTVKDFFLFHYGCREYDKHQEPLPMAFIVGIYR